MSYGQHGAYPGAVEEPGLVDAPQPPPTKVIIDDGGTRQAFIHQPAGVQVPQNQYGQPQQYPAPYPPPGHHQQRIPQQGQYMGPPGPQVNVVMGGNCPRCRVGYMTEEYSCCGIALAMIFFPIGLLCCLFMKDLRCANCGFNNGGDCC